MLLAKKMRSIAAVIALIGLICVFSACSNDAMPQRLSELDEATLLQRLSDHEIVIPAGLEISAIRDAIADLEDDPDRPARVVNWSVFPDFYEELRSFVKEHNASSQ